MPTSQAKSHSRENSYDVMRLLAACSVIVSHSYSLLNLPENDFIFSITRGARTASSIGLAIFFILSGMLISRSAESSHNVYLFICNRITRIYPGLIAVSIFTAFIIAPAVCTTSIWEQIFQTSTFLYPLQTITLWGFKLKIPGIFPDNPLSEVCNIPLWTLGYEFSFYIATWILVRVIKIKRIILPAMFVLLLMAMLIWGNDWVGKYWKPSILRPWDLAQFGAWFLAGMIINVYNLETEIKKGRWPIIAATLLLIGSHTKWMMQIEYISYPILTIYFGAPLSNIAKIYARIGDISYGLYIWGWPCAQVLIHIFGAHSFTPTSLTIATISATAPIAYMSWRWVEKPSLMYLRTKTSLIKAIHYRKVK